MKKILLSCVFFTLVLVNACKNDHANPVGYDYHITILSPDTSDKQVGDDINIKVDFEDLNGGTVHHINLKIYNVADTSDVIYDLPVEPHVHETSGFYEWDENFTLDSTKVQPNSDWILRASVWGHDDGIAVVTDSIGFHVLPQ